jgi:hypothetical protein
VHRRAVQRLRLAELAVQLARPRPRYIGAYIEPIGRSLERRAVEKLSIVSRLHQGDLGCLDPTCCPRGFDSLLGAGRRQHAVRSRLRDLEALDIVGARKWMLRHLSDRALDAMTSARHIRVAANNIGSVSAPIRTSFEAMYVVTQNLMATARVTGSGGGVA